MKKLLIVVICLIFSGCGPTKEELALRKCKSIEIDGTKCVLCEMSFGGGVDCDFATTELEKDN